MQTIRSVSGAFELADNPHGFSVRDLPVTEDSLWRRCYEVPPEKKSNHQCRVHGCDHRSYGWSPQIDPRWTIEQQQAYCRGYDG
jgi:hypothetical protein